MKKHKIDSLIKEKLESQRVTPTPELWDTLSTRLAKDQSKIRSKKIIWSTAAIFVLALGTAAFFTIQKSSLLEFQNTEGVSFESPSSKEILNELDNKPFVLEEETVLPKTESIKKLRRETVLTFTEKQAIIPFIVRPNFDEKIVQIELKDKLNDKVWSASLEENLLNLEIDSLMNLAFEHLEINKSEEARRKKQALNLLRSVEEELNSEIYFKRKVLDILKSSYSRANVAQNEN